MFLYDICTRGEICTRTLNIAVNKMISLVLKLKKKWNICNCYFLHNKR